MQNSFEGPRSLLVLLLTLYFIISPGVQVVFLWQNLAEFSWMERGIVGKLNSLLRPLTFGGI